jgi:hypothetical protein
MGRALIAVLIVLVMLKLCVAVARADHLVYLPGLPTPLINSIKQTQTVKWCANQAAHNYPNFIAQVEDVQNEYTKRVGIRFERVSYGTLSATGCQVQHNMQEFSCSGCAAHIFYANWPVVIEYKPSLGYTDWRSAIGHELGHGLLGLHEQYKDSGGIIQCVSRSDTVMSCGAPFVRYPQPLDVTRGCPVIATSWCGQAAPIEYPIYDAARNCMDYGYWCYDFDDGIWYDPQNVSEWQPAVNGQLYNRREQVYYWTLPVSYRHNGTTWECIANCL